MQIKLLIGLPTNRAQMFTATAFSLTNLVRTLLMAGIGYDLLNIDSVDIATARNSIATKCHDNAQYSHLLFIDDDMGFDGDAVLALLRANKDVVGCLCPRRELDMRAFHEASASGADLEVASARALNFAVSHLSPVEGVIRDEMCEINGIGMGITLIRRDVLTAMASNGAAPVRKPGRGRDTIGQTSLWGFFEQIFDPVTNTVLSEDYSFCKRWRELCGGQIFGLTHEKIAHVGRHDFEGRYIDWVRGAKA
jgi:hypothetical protein